MIQKFKVIDKETGRTKGVYSTYKRARNKADKLDLNFGAYRFGVQGVLE